MKEQVAESHNPMVGLKAGSSGCEYCHDCWNQKDDDEQQMWKLFYGERPKTVGTSLTNRDFRENTDEMYLFEAQNGVWSLVEDQYETGPGIVCHVNYCPACGRKLTNG